MDDSMYHCRHHKEMAELEDEVGLLRSRVEDQKLDYGLLAGDYNALKAVCNDLRSELALARAECKAYGSQMLEMQQECIAMRIERDKFREEYNDALAERDAFQHQNTLARRAFERIGFLQATFLRSKEPWHGNDIASAIQAALRGEP